MSGINQDSFSFFQSGVLISDEYQAPNGSPDSIPEHTKVDFQPVDAALEIKSTSGGLLLPRMTSAQRDDLVAAEGMTIYNTDTGRVDMYESGGWSALLSSDDPIIVTEITLDPGSAADPSLNFSTDLVTGLFLPGVGLLGIAARGALQVEVGGSNLSVNYFKLEGNTTGNNPTISALGSDADVGFSFKGKGTTFFDFDSTVATNSLTISPAGFADSVLLSAIAPGADSGIAIQTKGAGVTSLLAEPTNTNPGTLRFYNPANTFYNEMKAGALASNVAFILPTSIVAGNFLKTDELGNTSWENPTLADIFSDGAGDLFVGSSAGRRAATGISSNTIMGLNCAPLLGDDASSNTAIGHNAFQLFDVVGGGNNTVIGASAGATYANYSTCTFVGVAADAAGNAAINANAFGAGAIAPDNNSMALGKDITSISTNTLGCTLGIASLPFSGLYLGATAASILIDTVTPAATRTYTIPELGQNASFVLSSINNVATDSVALKAGNTYYTNNATLVTYTLPVTATVGDRILIRGAASGTAGWKVAQNASQLIRYIDQVTTTGTGGSLQSTNQFDCIALECIVTDTTWLVVNSSGNITVV